jgi:hypothetical protein
MVRSEHLRWTAMKRFIVIMLMAAGLFLGLSSAQSNIPEIILHDTLS